MHPIEIAEHSLVEREIKYSLKEVIILATPAVYMRTKLFRKKPFHYIRKKIKKAIRKQVKKLRKILFPKVLSPSL